LLDKADTLSWNNQWAEAKPLYEHAAAEFAKQNQPSRALYATVSEIPADETVSASTYVVLLTNDLQKPEAQEPETRLRILTILGIIETNYNAALALPTWKTVQQLAIKQGHLMLASRAQGEQGIAAYILGDKAAGARLTIRAWTLAKAEHDSAATVRYASLYGAGLVEMERYKQAFTPLNEALRLAQQTPSVAYSSLAMRGCRRTPQLLSARARRAAGSSSLPCTSPFLKNTHTRQRRWTGLKQSYATCL
jgi:hypothetical protein